MLSPQPLQVDASGHQNQFAAGSVGDGDRKDVQVGKVELENGGEKVVPAVGSHTFGGSTIRGGEPDNAIARRSAQVLSVGFAKLQCGKEFQYVMNERSTSLGRRTHGHPDVDCHLSGEKNISRKHAVISFRRETGVFELTVLGKNGVKVNKKTYYPYDGPAPLASGSQVQVGRCSFLFVLPTDVPPGERGHFVNKEREPSNPFSTMSLEKPSYSYASLIAQAIMCSPEKKITLAQIYKWVKDTYPYYRTCHPTWRNSIRHNLSLNKAFVRIARQNKDTGGKGSYWTIVPDQRDMFSGGHFRRRSRPIATVKSPDSSVSSATLGETMSQMFKIVPPGYFSPPHSSSEYHEYPGMMDSPVGGGTPSGDNREYQVSALSPPSSARSLAQINSGERPAQMDGFGAFRTATASSVRENFGLAAHLEAGAEPREAIRPRGNNAAEMGEF